MTKFDELVKALEDEMTNGYTVDAVTFHSGMSDFEASGKIMFKNRRGTSVFSKDFDDVNSIDVDAELSRLHNIDKTFAKNCYEDDKEEDCLRGRTLDDYYMFLGSTL